MRREIAEGDLVFSFEDPFLPVRFDDDATHGMYDRMKKVDFIVASPQYTWLIEVKDPENRTIPTVRAAAQRHAFRNRLSPVVITMRWE